MRNKHWLGATVAMTATIGMANSAVITFEAVVPVSDPVSPCYGVPTCTAPHLDVDGFRFKTAVLGFDDHFHLVSTPFAFAGQIYASNGTKYIGLDAIQLEIRRIDGAAFSLSTFDAAEGFLSGGSLITRTATSLLIEGSLTGGGTTMTTFIFDGVNDGSGGATDFQSVSLPSAFGDVTSVVLRGLRGSVVDGAFSIDNVAVSEPIRTSVPEPASLALLATMAGAGVVLGRRHR